MDDRPPLSAGDVMGWNSVALVKSFISSLRDSKFVQHGKVDGTVKVKQLCIGTQFEKIYRFEVKIEVARVADNQLDVKNV